VLHGPGRVQFRAVLRSICYSSGQDIFLASSKVLNRDFIRYAEKISAREHAQKMAESLRRPY
jgi:hypothetical protein